MSTNTTARRLESLSSNIQSTIKLCQTSKKRSELIKGLSSLSASLSGELARLKETEKRRFMDVRRSLQAVHNTVTGLVEGLASQDLERKDFKKIVANLEATFFPAVCQAVAAELEKREEPQAEIVLSSSQAKVKMSLAQSKDWRAALTEIQQALKEAVVKEEVAQKTAVAPQDNEDAVAVQIRQLQSSRNLLPIRIKGEFQIVRMPIIPIFSQIQLNNSSTLTKIGVRHSMIEGYALLLDQTLLAVSDAIAKKHELSTFAFAESVVALLNERGGINYSLVSDQQSTNPRNADIKLFWILPTPKTNALMRIARTSVKSNSIKWGLPF